MKYKQTEETNINTERKETTTETKIKLCQKMKMLKRRSKTNKYNEINNIRKF